MPIIAFQQSQTFFSSQDLFFGLLSLPFALASKRNGLQEQQGHFSCALHTSPPRKLKGANRDASARKERLSPVTHTEIYKCSVSEASHHFLTYPVVPIEVVLFESGHDYFEGVHGPFIGIL